MRDGGWGNREVRIIQADRQQVYMITIIIADQLSLERESGSDDIYLHDCKLLPTSYPFFHWGIHLFTNLLDIFI